MSKGQAHRRGLQNTAGAAADTPAHRAARKYVRGMPPDPHVLKGYKYKV